LTPEPIELCVSLSGVDGVQGRYVIRRALDGVTGVIDVKLRPGYQFRVLVVGDVEAVRARIASLRGIGRVDVARDEDLIRAWRSRRAWDDRHGRRS
jgi:hypothetical protein